MTRDETLKVRASLLRLYTDARDRADESSVAYQMAVHVGIAGPAFAAHVVEARTLELTYGQSVTRLGDAAIRMCGND